MTGAVFQLKGNQRAAVEPQDSVWLSASAGTGKTQVLSARVLRLLLQPHVDPSQILCLTFTKAGAAEMANRINSVLARWVRIDSTVLGKELEHIGASNSPETRDRARTLFASVLDCPGGGLRIDTIHAFSQWQLANFPNEADMMPGMRPMEDRERALLARDVLTDMLVDAEQHNDVQVLRTVAEFTRSKGQDALQKWLMRCANLSELWYGPSAWQPPMTSQVKQLLGLPSGADDSSIAEMCDDDTFDTVNLLRCQQTLAAWDSATGREGAEAIAAWLAASPIERAAMLDELYFALFTKTTDAPKQLKNILKRDPEYGTYIDKVQANISLIRDFRALMELSKFLAPALELGRNFALRWDAAKAREGLLDFDDLIKKAADLLRQKDAADWIRFKLDRRFDHILIDEAQDTNEAQWKIIDALIDDFFSGLGASGDKLRTIFTVGDYKQAIFGFQGTSPENFRMAKERVKASIASAVGHAAEARVTTRQRELQDLDLGQSFRTSTNVLEFVDRAVEAIGPTALGIQDEYKPHVGQARAGLVTLWNPVRDTRDSGDSESSDSGEEGWLAKHDRKMAERIARQVQRWLDPKGEPFALEKGEHRSARAGDIMVLVRSRKDLAGLIVARLHARGVPVAGVDRLRLGEPLAVKDLMSAIRFAAQPLDDLELANLLSSPLLGWSQDDLLDYVPRNDGKRLWDHLRKHDAPFVQSTAERLRELLALADYETPQALLEWMLVGPWQARAKLIARLGQEANDPINELVNSAFAYESGNTPSLAGFIQWFDAGEGELKRDPDDAPDLVRVMTVHGSKGLQAPIVILADATSKPTDVRELELEEHVPRLSDQAARRIPLPSVKSGQRKGRLEDAHEAAKAKEIQEHWRLLYVAMTRAEEALFIGGSLGPKAKEPHPDSWYARLAPLMGEDALEDAIWEGRKEFGTRAAAVREKPEKPGHVSSEAPDWLTRPIGPEPTPPRPLAPSSAGDDNSSDPPLSSGDAQFAAKRGILIHALLERLPDVPSTERVQKVTDWLARNGHEFSETERDAMRDQALNVLQHPQFADTFADNSLAEVPIAATVGGQVIAGTIDRLLVDEQQVKIVDFKTARRPPSTVQDIPASICTQMAAYVAALEQIYPGKTVHAAVLYTQTPQLFELSQELIELHKNVFADG